MLRASTLRIIGWVLLTPVVLATAYMLLEIWLFDIDPCSPFICTEDYPCFDQGNCSHWKAPRSDRLHAERAYLRIDGVLCVSVYV
jgi:hypothetical protein